MSHRSPRRTFALRPARYPGGSAHARGSLVVAYCGRGAVVWRAGRLRYAGPSDQNRRDLQRAVEALIEIENVDLSSAEQVRAALLSIGGARLLRDPLNRTH